MDIQLLLAPYDTARRGWRSGAGPEHLVQAGLPAHLESLGHRVAGIQVIEDDPAESPAEIRTTFELIRRVATAVRDARAAGRFPVVLSGNCNVGAVGTLSGLTPEPRSIFWFDAHGESNTPETTGSGFLDGMALSIALGWCWRVVAASVPGFLPVAPEATFLIGARDLDPLEAALLSESRVTLVPVSDVSTGLSDRLAAAPLPEGLGYMHLDLDVLDPDSVGRANSLPAPGRALRRSADRRDHRRPGQDAPRGRHHRLLRTGVRSRPGGLPRRVRGARSDAGARRGVAGSGQG
jgi:arginase